PLVAAAVLELAPGDLVRFASTGGALACLWGGGALAAAGLAAEARYFLGRLAGPPRLPLKLLSLVATALGAGLAALAGGHEWPGAVLFGGLAALGHRAFYGRDPRAHRVAVAATPGVDVDIVATQLEQAHGRLQGIERAAATIAVPEFGERLRRITAIGRRILAEIEHDPRDAARARKFLNVYLDGAEKITTEYARTHRQLGRRALEENFRQLLIDIETTFDAQHRKLLDHEALALDVEIEVLAARLKREGVS
ncbi:MAG: 5-bromo-4-chloroindolyl phosphate hydrolysis family protein, partial [Gammaproteobacteria bacterium]